MITLVPWWPPVDKGQTRHTTTMPATTTGTLSMTVACTILLIISVSAAGASADDALQTAEYIDYELEWNLHQDVTSEVVNQKPDPSTAAAATANTVVATATNYIGSITGTTPVTHFPASYAALIQQKDKRMNVTVVNNTAVDVKHLSSQLSDITLELIFDRERNRNYTARNYNGKLYCGYSNQQIYLTNTEYTPNVTAATYVTGGDTVIRGLSCNQFTGSLCEHFDPTRNATTCAEYVYYEAKDGFAPVRFHFMGTDTDYLLFNDTIDPSAFALEQGLSCPRAPPYCAHHCREANVTKDAFGLNITLCNEWIMPSWVLAVAVGLTSGYTFFTLPTNVIGRIAYGITFTTYAFMISSGFVTHSIFLVECKAASPTPAYDAWARIDAGLTSFIAMTFLYGALVDIGVLQEKSKYFVVLYGATLLTILYLYFETSISFEYLYKGLIAVGCGSFLVIQAILMFERKSIVGLGAAVAGALAGAVGYMPISTLFRCWFCTNVGINTEVWWYYLSDVAVACVAVFVYKIRPSPSSLFSPSSYYYPVFEDPAAHIRKQKEALLTMPEQPSKP